MITRQMLYSALPVPATAAFAITSSIHPEVFGPGHPFRPCSLRQYTAWENPSPGLYHRTDNSQQIQGQVNFSAQRPSHQCSRLFLLQNCAYRQFCSGRHRKLPLPLGEAGHRQNDDMRPGTKGNFRWRAAQVLAVHGDVRAGRCRAEITPYFLQGFLRRNLLRRNSGRCWRGHGRALPWGSCVPNWLSCNCSRSRLRTGSFRPSATSVYNCFRTLPLSST